MERIEQINGTMGIAKSEHAIAGECTLDLDAWQNVSAIEIRNDSDDRIVVTVERVPQEPQGKIIVHLRVRVE